MLGRTLVILLVAAGTRADRAGGSAFIPISCAARILQPASRARDVRTCVWDVRFHANRCNLSRPTPHAHPRTWTSGDFRGGGAERPRVHVVWLGLQHRWRLCTVRCGATPSRHGPVVCARACVCPAHLSAVSSRPVLCASSPSHSVHTLRSVRRCARARAAHTHLLFAVTRTSHRNGIRLFCSYAWLARRSF